MVFGNKFGVIPEQIGKDLESYVLVNQRGMRVTIVNYGARIAGVVVPDRHGTPADVVLGFDDLSSYVGARFYMGATIGRFADRISGGGFTLHGKKYQVTLNSDGSHLHGGAVGFDKKFWKAAVAGNPDKPELEFKLLSPDGDEGYPGTVEVIVTYTVSDNNELQIRYSATTDKSTIINLSNHTYFNLTGSAANSILDHILMVDADSFTPMDKFSIPTGEMASVEDTPMDFRKPRRVGDRIDVDYSQLKLAGGYDHNWALNKYDGTIHKAGSLYEPSTGRLVEVFTDQPSLQVYSGNNFDGSIIGKNGVPLNRRSGLCLECQHFPDSPNKKEFPSVVVEPRATYRQTTVYKFSTIW